MKQSGPVNISFLSTSFPRFEGDFAGNFVLHYAQELTNLGIKLEVVAPDDPVSRPLPEKFDTVRFPYFYPRAWQKLAYGSGIITQPRLLVWFQLPFLLINFFFAALRSARKTQIIHAFWSASGIIALMVRLIKPRPVVITLWGSDKLIARVPILSKIILSVLNTADAIICEDISLKSYLISRGFNPEKTFLIRNGVNLNLFKPQDSLEAKNSLGLNVDHKIILSVGSLNRTKNHSLLIDAFSKLSESNPTWNLYIIGEGEEKQNLDKQIRQKGLAQKIFLLGFKEHNSLSQWLNAADIFVLSSLSEGTPNALLEAMGCGLPVIASNVGGIPELIQDNIEGLLFESNSKEELAEKLNFLIQNQDQQEQLGKNAVKRIRNEFGSWKIQAEKLLSIYQQLHSSTMK